MKFYGKLLAVALAWGFPFGQGIQQLPLGNLLSDQEIKFDQSLTDNCHKAVSESSSIAHLRFGKSSGF